MRYQIERRLGAGGMAEVYEATAHGDNGFRRKVAIKRLASGRVDDAALRRAMVQEARVAATLHHPGIVAVLDVGEIDGSPMQVLDLGLDGAPLGISCRDPNTNTPLIASAITGTELRMALVFDLLAVGPSLPSCRVEKLRIACDERTADGVDATAVRTSARRSAALPVMSWASTSMHTR